MNPVASITDGRESAIMAETEILKAIYQNLQDGKVYGYMFTKCKYPFFDVVLYRTLTNYIGWSNFGSSANENTLEELEWIVKTIFKCTPSEFVKKYELR